MPKEKQKKEYEKLIIRAGNLDMLQNQQSKNKAKIVNIVPVVPEK